jgi:hypothetical protein
MRLFVLRVYTEKLLTFMIVAVRRFVLKEETITFSKIIVPVLRLRESKVCADKLFA